MHFFEDALAALGRRIDRCCSALGRLAAGGFAPSASRPSHRTSRRHDTGLGNWIDDRRERLRYFWALMPERTRRRWTVAGIGAVATIALSATVVSARLIMSGSNLTAEEQRLVDELAEKIRDAAIGGAGDRPLFPGAH